MTNTILSSKISHTQYRLRSDDGGPGQAFGDGRTLYVVEVRSLSDRNWRRIHSGGSEDNAREAFHRAVRAATIGTVQ